jgi:hypothetical protein
MWQGPKFPLGETGGSHVNYKNSGNEAKKWLKTKDIAFLKGAIAMRFACKFAQTGG